MQTTLKALKKHLSNDSIEQLFNNLESIDLKEISMCNILASNGIIDAQMSFPAFIGQEQLGLRYLVACLKNIQPLLKNERIKSIFLAIEQFTTEKIEAHEEWILLQNFLLEIEEIMKESKHLYRDLYSATNEIDSEKYKKIAAAEGINSVYCLVRWAIYSNPIYKTNEKIPLEEKLFHMSFSNSLQSAVNSISYQKASEIIQNNQIYQNVLQCCLNKQQKIFEEMIISQHATELP